MRRPRRSPAFQTGATGTHRTQRTCGWRSPRAKAVQARGQVGSSVGEGTCWHQSCGLMGRKMNSLRSVTG
jgi:hypothetical protein